jgi:hypothetical protein
MHVWATSSEDVIHLMMYRYFIAPIVHQTNNNALFEAVACITLFKVTAINQQK